MVSNFSAVFIATTNPLSIQKKKNLVQLCQNSNIVFYISIIGITDVCCIVLKEFFNLSWVKLIKKSKYRVILVDVLLIALIIYILEPFSETEIIIYDMFGEDHFQN